MLINFAEDKIIVIRGRVEQVYMSPAIFVCLFVCCPPKNLNTEEWKLLVIDHIPKIYIKKK